MDQAKLREDSVRKLQDFGWTAVEGSVLSFWDAEEARLRARLLELEQREASKCLIFCFAGGARHVTMLFLSM